MLFSPYTRSVRVRLIKLSSSGGGILILYLFLACPPLFGQDTNAIRSWNKYRIIMWVGDTAYKHPEKLPLFYKRLREMGVNTVMAYADGDLSPMVEAQMPYYVENVIQSQLTNLKASVSVPVDARVRIYRFRYGNVLLLAFERNIEYQMSEDLKQTGGNEVLEKPIELRALLKTTQHSYDLRHKMYLGFRREIQFTLDPWQPSLFAVANDRNTVESLLR